ncbi:acyltransferase family protein [Paenibacillus sp. 481]|uniref:acyltransferase family protein n=1 Tax=Paenibacillus sp. 481 TaxID=2835869 RepID=UPI001E5572A2|nr:acyltransferase family protein [Paenibacillus sp. 481]UHA71869.1 acyltransferase family protein [Paenibacillus sp. 481]
METQQQRDYLIDNCKGLLMFLVVLGHGLEYLRKEYELAEMMYVFIYLFHMPVFVFISGYLSKNIEKGRNNAVKNLLVPFLFFNVIWNFLQLASGWFTGVGKGVATIQLFSFFTPGWALWYLFSMFLWRLLLPDMLKIKNVLVVSVVIGLVARMFTEFDVFMSLSRTLVFTPFFLAGYYTNKGTLQKLRAFGKIPSIVMTILGVVVAIWFVTQSRIPVEFLWADRVYAEFERSDLQSIVLAAFVYGISFAFVYVFINLIPQTQTLLSKIGKNTMSVYLLHTYLISIVLAISPLVPSHAMQLAIIVGSSVVVTLLLSRDKVAARFGRFLNGLNRKIFVESKHNM